MVGKVVVAEVDAEVGKRDRVTNLLAGFFFIACGVLEGACGGPPTLYTVTYGTGPQPA